MAHDLRLTTPPALPPTRKREKGAGLQEAGGTAPLHPLSPEYPLSLEEVVVTEVGGVEPKLIDFSSSSNELIVTSLPVSDGGSKVTDEGSKVNDKGSKVSLSARPTSNFGLRGEGRGGENGNPSFIKSLVNHPTLCGMCEETTPLVSLLTGL